MLCFRHRPWGEIVFLCAALLCMTQSLIAANSGDIKGRVFDKETKDAMTGAHILIAGTSIGTASDKDGSYVIHGAPAGSQTLSISYVGYKPVSIKITVKEGEVLQQDIFMEPSTVTGEEVVITAQAHGQMEAINQQLSSNTISNVVSADRIKEIPDANAAETIARLPGISLVRSGGEGQKVTIRGMAPQYNIMMVSGVRMESTDRDNRSVDLNMIDPNVLSGIEVKKALTADMDADAVGGTVDLKIGKAKEGFHFNISAQGGYGSMADTYGNYKYSALVRDRFFDNKLGVQLSGFADRYNRNSDELSANYNTNSTTEIQNGLLTMYLKDASILHNTTDRKRAGGSLVFDYQLPFGSLMLNNLISSINEHKTTEQNALALIDFGWSGYAEEFTSTNTVITNALQGEFDFSFIKMNFSLSNSITKMRMPDDLTMSIGPKTGGGSMWGDTLLSTTGLLTASPTDLLNTYNIKSTASTTAIFQTLKTLERNVDEGAQSAVVNFEVPFTVSNSLSGTLKLGGKYVRNTRENDESQAGLSLNSDIAGQTFIPLLKSSLWPDLGIGNDNTIYASFFADPNYNVGNFLAGKEGVSNNAFYNLLSIWKMRHLEELAKTTTFPYTADGVTINKSYYFPNIQASTQYDYNYTRYFTAFYVMAELNVGDFITLTPGIRYERYHFVYDADITYESAALTTLGATAFTITPIHWDSTKSENWFPQIQLRVKPTNWLDIRLASTKSIIYPDYRAVSPYLYFSSASTPAFLQIGNPYLSPAITQNYDIYTSVYDNSIGLFTAGVFYKKIDNFIARQSNFSTKDPAFENYRVPLSTTAYTTVTTWYNLKEASFVRGIEIDWQTHFWYLPSFLSGIVLNVNYTQIASEAYYPYQEKVKKNMFSFYYVDTTRSGRLLEQPNKILNLTIGYDIGDFSARLSYQYTDNVLLYSDPIQEELDKYTAPYSRWDFTAFQKIPWVEGLQVFLNINNITDRPDRQYSSVQQKLANVQYYGRTADLGVRYSF
jgi:TonB-dependent receptor